jgi:hypothetical protein
MVQEDWVSIYKDSITYAACWSLSCMHWAHPLMFQGE